jgi:hypothetical protein
VLPHEDGFPAGPFDGVDPNDHEAFMARYQQVKEQLAIPIPHTPPPSPPGHRSTPQRWDRAPPSQGHGLIAATACGRNLPSPPGALKI